MYWCAILPVSPCGLCTRAPSSPASHLRFHSSQVETSNALTLQAARHYGPAPMRPSHRPPSTTRAPVPLPC